MGHMATLSPASHQRGTKHDLYSMGRETMPCPIRSKQKTEDSKLNSLWNSRKKSWDDCHRAKILCLSGWDGAVRCPCLSNVNCSPLALKISFGLCGVTFALVGTPPCLFLLPAPRPAQPYLRLGRNRKAFIWSGSQTAASPHSNKPANHN